MPYSFKKATLSTSKLVIGLSAETGGGKTYTALRLAKGLARGGKIVAIETERLRINRYADEFDFDVAEVRPPFRPQAYREAMQEGFKLNPAVMIIDSGTHEWVGEGGCLEWHNEVCRFMAKKWGGSDEKYNFQAWGEVKPDHWKLISDFEAPPCHIIVTFRAKEKFLQTKKDGKTIITSRGLCPDGSEDLPYTMDLIAILDGEKPGVPSFGYKHLSHKFKDIFKPGEQITEQHGLELALMTDGAPRSVSFTWYGSDGTGRDFPDADYLFRAVLKGINGSTDKDVLEKSLKDNAELLTKIDRDLSDKIHYAVKEKILRLSGVTPPI